MFERIVVPLDGTEHAERALPVAARIAHATNGTLIVISVLPHKLKDASYVESRTTQVVTSRTRPPRQDEGSDERDKKDLIPSKIWHDFILYKFKVLYNFNLLESKKVIYYNKA